MYNMEDITYNIYISNIFFEKIRQYLLCVLKITYIYDIISNTTFKLIL